MEWDSKKKAAMKGPLLEQKKHLGNSKLLKYLAKKKTHNVFSSEFISFFLCNHDLFAKFVKCFFSSVIKEEIPAPTL